MAVLEFPKKRQEAENGLLRLMFCKHCLKKHTDTVHTDKNNIISLRVPIYDAEGLPFHAHLSLHSSDLEIILSPHMPQLVDLAEYATVHCITEDIAAVTESRMSQTLESKASATILPVASRFC